MQCAHSDSKSQIRKKRGEAPVIFPDTLNPAYFLSNELTQ